MYGRHTFSLNGTWQYIIDPYETGFYNYRFKEMPEKDPAAYWNSDVPQQKTDRIEHGYSDKYTLQVPGDWNSQDPVFLYYEGSVWHKKSFDYNKKDPSNRLFIYFGAVIYQADVYMNGKKLGSHKGGFTAFQFEIPDAALREKDNFLVVKVDNKHDKNEIPVYWTVNFENTEVLEKAKTQLTEMITRDRNRASIIIWSVGNETPVSSVRTAFMKDLVSETGGALAGFHADSLTRGIIIQD